MSTIQTAVACCCCCWLSLTDVHGEMPTVQVLIEAHRSAIGQIHSFELTHSGETHVFAEMFKMKKPTRSHVVHWARDGDRERFRYDLYRVSPGPTNGQKERFGELSRNGKEFRILDGWDWKNPPKLTPFDQKGVSGQTNPAYGSGPHYGQLACTDALLHTFYRSRSGERLSLAELQAQAETVRVDVARAKDGAACWRLYLSGLPQRDADSDARVESEIYIDQQTQIVKRYIEHYRNEDWPVFDGRELRGKERGDMEVDWWIVKTRTFDNGIEFPVETEQEIRRGTRVALHSWTHINVTTLNTPLPADALAFQFPKYAMITHAATANRPSRIELWGDDDKPLKEIRNGNDLSEYAHLQIMPASKSALVSNQMLILFAVSVIAGTFFLRRRRRGAA